MAQLSGRESKTKCRENIKWHQRQDLILAHLEINQQFLAQPGNFSTSGNCYSITIRRPLLAPIFWADVGTASTSSGRARTRGRSSPWTAAP